MTVFYICSVFDTQQKNILLYQKRKKANIAEQGGKESRAMKCKKKQMVKCKKLYETYKNQKKQTMYYYDANVKCG